MANNETKIILSAVDQTREAFSSVERNMKSMSEAGRVMKTALASIGFGLTIREVFSLTNGFADMQNRLKLVTSGSADLAAVTGKLYEVAQNTRQSFGDTADMYSRIARSAGELGLSQEQLLTITQTVNNAIMVSGASTAEAAAGVMQFGQALASGRLQGDELRSILENMPRLARAIADGMGVTVGRLRELGKEGQLTSEVISQAVLSQSAVINSEAGQMAVTLTQATTQMQNALLKYIGEADQATQSTGDLAKAISDLANDTDFGTFITGATLGVSDFVRALVGGVKTAVFAFHELGIGVNAAGEQLYNLLTFKWGKIGDVGRQAAARMAKVRDEYVASIAALNKNSFVFGENSLFFGNPQLPSPKPGAVPSPPPPGAGGDSTKGKKQKPFDPDADFWFAVDEAAMKSQQKRNEEYLKGLVKAEEEAQQQMQRSALEAQRIVADTDPIFKVSLAWEELTALVEQGLLTQEQAGKAYEKTFKDLDKAGNDAFKSLEDAVRGWGNQFTDEMVKMMRTGKVSFSSLADSIINDLLRIQVQKNITDKLVSSGTSFLDNIFGGIFGGGGGGGGGGTPTGMAGFSPAQLAGPVMSFAGGGYTGLGSRAGGIDGKGGFPAILHPNETVIDHTRNAAKSGDTYYIDARGADSAAIGRLESLIMSLNGSIERRALGAVNQALVSRGQQAIRA